MYTVFMADMPIYDYFIDKVETLEEAIKIVKEKKRTAVPYQNFYIKNDKGEIVSI